MSDINSIVGEGLKKHLNLSDESLRESIVFSLENRITGDMPLILVYRDAKKVFQKKYFQDLLTLNHGNVKRAASIAGLDRRQIHRICKKLGIDTKDIRVALVKPKSYLKQSVQEIVEQKVDLYSRKNDIKLSYENIPRISDELSIQVAAVQKSYDDAFFEFEKNYLGQLMKKADNNLLFAEELSGLSAKSISRKMKAIA